MGLDMKKKKNGQRRVTCSGQQRFFFHADVQLHPIFFFSFLIIFHQLFVLMHSHVSLQFICLYLNICTCLPGTLRFISSPPTFDISPFSPFYTSHNTVYYILTQK